MTYEHPLWPLALKNPTAVPLAQEGGDKQLIVYGEEFEIHSLKSVV